jgi:hypothetical protein
MAVNHNVIAATEELAAEEPAIAAASQVADRGTGWRPEDDAR